MLQRFSHCGDLTGIEPKVTRHCCSIDSPSPAPRGWGELVKEKPVATVYGAIKL